MRKTCATSPPRWSRAARLREPLRLVQPGQDLLYPLLLCRQVRKDAHAPHYGTPSYPPVATHPPKPAPLPCRSPTAAAGTRVHVAHHGPKPPDLVPFAKPPNSTGTTLRSATTR